MARAKDDKDSKKQTDRIQTKKRTNNLDFYALVRKDEAMHA